MKQLSILFTICFFTSRMLAQTTPVAKDSAAEGKLTVIKDSRLETLQKKQAAFNETMANIAARTAKGYRLMLLSTNDRNYAMNIRAQLLQKFPEQKVYMSFQPPYIKLKFGNFLDKDEAEQYRKDISKSKLISTNIYLVPETIEVKPDKTKETL